MAILIEAITLALGLKKLEEGKALLRAQMAKTPIRINKNIVEPLLKKKLVSRLSDGNFQLTSKGRKQKIKKHLISLTIEEYFNLDDVNEFVKKATKRRRPIYKVMITTCLACGVEYNSAELQPITDQDGILGVYCEKCLTKKGYFPARQTMLDRSKRK